MVPPFGKLLIPFSYHSHKQLEVYGKPVGALWERGTIFGGTWKFPWCSEAPLSCCMFSWDVGENPPSHSPDGPTAKTAMEETKTSRDNAREASWEQIRRADEGL